MGLKISGMSAASTLTGDELLEVSQLSTVVTITATTLSAAAADNSYNDSGSGFLTAGFAVGDVVRVTGFTGNVANNIVAGTITVITAAKMTIGGTDGDVIVDDAAGESVTISKRVTRRATLSDVIATASGTELRGLTFTSDTGSTADSDPGAGLFKWNNATQASATFLYFDDVTVDTVNLDTFYTSLGTSGFIYLQQSDDETKWQLWKWTTTPTDGTGYWKFPVTLQASGGSIVDAKTVFCDFAGAGGGGSTVGKHLIPITASSMRPRETNGCAAHAAFAGAANQPDFVYLAFDTTTTEYAEFSIPMPESWNESTVTFMPIWSHPSTTVNFGVVWQLQAVAVSNDDAMAATFGTVQSSTDTGGTTDDLYIGPESSAITIAGTPAAGDMVFFRINRLPSDGSDTLAVDARLMGIRLYYTTDASTDT